ncbi:hypothetical protein [Brevibacillus sp. SYSU BS000544]|uniref:hypothetical protein n=1 Tax=Brevibacillus sp. SYSU BS000544 TaxID=3416443 RepID=UPI003CE461D4
MIYENGKPNLVAIVLLSEIVYWYRPTLIRNESTGEVTELKKKFKADKLQRDYHSFAEQFGFSKRQVKEAFDYLEREIGVIDRDFRTIRDKSKVLNNVLYIGLNPELLKRITFEKFHTLLHSNAPPSYISTEEGGALERRSLLHPNVPLSYIPTEEGGTLESKTNTEITTKITPEITTNISTEITTENNRSSQLVSDESPLPKMLQLVVTRKALTDRLNEIQSVYELVKNEPGYSHAEYARLLGKQAIQKACKAKTPEEFHQYLLGALLNNLADQKRRQDIVNAAYPIIEDKLPASILRQREREREREREKVDTNQKTSISVKDDPELNKLLEELRLDLKSKHRPDQGFDFGEEENKDKDLSEVGERPY